MTGNPDSSAASLPSLAGVAWLAARPTTEVMAALRAAGHEGRVVGGCVRNALMGLPVTDIDIATDAVPSDVVRICATAGLETIPTGLAHGTVTVVVDRTPIEVTTLRRDVDTDGRHATVAYTADWAEDARRRDFTMNALYADANGRLHDPVGGYPDLLARRVRFIGDPDARIREDYLRILRFFRFFATYALGDADPGALAACARGIGGLSRLSAERVRAEIVKLLAAPRAVDAIRAMGGVGLLPPLLGAAPRPGVFAAVAETEASFARPPDAMLRLSALAIAVVEDIPRLADRLRLSNAERRDLLAVDGHIPGISDEPIAARHARRLVYRTGTDGARRLALALAATAPSRRPEAELLCEIATTWAAPSLPVGGADVVAGGMAPGPAIGRLLRDIEEWWIAEDFPEPAAVRRRLADVLADAGTRST